MKQGVCSTGDLRDHVPPNAVRTSKRPADKILLPKDYLFEVVSAGVHPNEISCASSIIPAIARTVYFGNSTVRSASWGRWMFLDNSTFSGFGMSEKHVSS